MKQPQSADAKATSQDYLAAEIEPKWQRHWDDMRLFVADGKSDKPKKYVLTMYPYPSGKLHMGHVINYTIGDVLSRYWIMKGFDVFSPMGWDSFGLPAENAAIKAGIHPADSIRTSIASMRDEMRRTGWGYDWGREIATSHPGYYKWTQWLFLQFFKKGLAVKKTAPVNWCPNDNTVLANEQVVNGECERCGTPVEQRDLEQWFFKMSEYAQRLLDGHKKLKGWPERVIRMQEEWIGRSEGARVDFTITETGETLSVFTTRPDTLYGVTFMCLAPEHKLVDELVKDTPQEEEVMKAVREMRQQGTAERERVELEKVGVYTGFHVTNPLNDEQVPLWVANFALMSYGTGAVMSVPAHDQRDFEFAKKYDIPIKVVIHPAGEPLDGARMTEAYVEDGIQVNSEQFDGLPNREAMSKITDYLKEIGKGEATINYRLRDWLLSRQRYWGAPIPIMYCSKCGTVPVSEEDLPVELPRDVEFKPTGESPLASCEKFVNATCPQCGGDAQRETDTMDTFVDSSWYFLRYCSPRLDDKAFDDEAVKHWMPVDQYVGGIEHATMHLIYCRFFTQVLHDIGLIPFDEPATNLFCQGMVCKVAHYCGKCKWLTEEEQESGKCKKCGSEVHSEVAKMSKTKLNTISPDIVLDKYGADTLRLYILSDTPPDRDQVWNDEGVYGCSRFLNRFWSLVTDCAETIRDVAPFSGNTNDLDDENKKLRRKTHQTISKVTDDIEKTMHFNTAIAAIMELLNAVKAAKSPRPEILKEALSSSILLLSPITPHISEELWQRIGNEPSIFNSQWPTFDKEAAAEDIVEMVIQINGKVRSRIEVPADWEQDAIKEAALADEKVKEQITGANIKKVVVVPGRLVNIVVAGK